MAVETLPRQRAMFTGEWVDGHSPDQQQPNLDPPSEQQLSLFPIREEVVLFGAHVRPWLKNAPVAPLELMREDPRTRAEVEAALQHQAECLTAPLFDPLRVTPSGMPDRPPQVAVEPSAIRPTHQRPRSLAKLPEYHIDGYRFKVRHGLLRVRPRDDLRWLRCP